MLAKILTIMIALSFVTALYSFAQEEEVVIEEEVVVEEEVMAEGEVMAEEEVMVEVDTSSGLLGGVILNGFI